MGRYGGSGAAVLKPHNSPHLSASPFSDLSLAASPHREHTYRTRPKESTMSFYDEVELEDLTFHPELLLYTYPCPCGDQFEICLSDMRDGEEVAVCPSCSLTIRVIFDQVSFWCFLYFPPPRPDHPRGDIYHTEHV